MDGLPNLRLDMSYVKKQVKYVVKNQSLHKYWLYYKIMSTYKKPFSLSTFLTDNTEINLSSNTDLILRQINRNDQVLFR